MWICINPISTGLSDNILSRVVGGGGVNLTPSLDLSRWRSDRRKNWHRYWETCKEYRCIHSFFAKTLSFNWYYNSCNDMHNFTNLLIFPTEKGVWRPHFFAQSVIVALSTAQHYQISQFRIISLYCFVLSYKTSYKWPKRQNKQCFRAIDKISISMWKTLILGEFWADMWLRNGTWRRIRLSDFRELGLKRCARLQRKKSWKLESHRDMRRSRESRRFCTGGVKLTPPPPPPVG